MSREVMNRDGRYGYCWCGCGEQTTVPIENHSQTGAIKGVPRRFRPGHNSRVAHPSELVIEYAEEDLGHDTPCWIWQGCISGVGYAYKGIGGRDVLAHRLYYERAIGPIPAGLQIDHLCRVRACVNPAHMEVVTNQENTRRGDRTKLTQGLADQIRRMGETASLSDSKIGALFGVGRSTVNDIRHGKRWKQVS